jgi:hypothetical protein
MARPKLYRIADHNGVTVADPRDGGDRVQAQMRADGFTPVTYEGRRRQATYETGWHSKGVVWVKELLFAYRIFEQWSEQSAYWEYRISADVLELEEVPF